MRLQLQTTRHYIVNHYVRMRLGGANNMRPLNWGRGGTNGKDAIFPCSRSSIFPIFQWYLVFFTYLKQELHEVSLSKNAFDDSKSPLQMVDDFRDKQWFLLQSKHWMGLNGSTNLTLESARLMMVSQTVFGKWLVLNTVYAAYLLLLTNRCTLPKRRATNCLNF